MKRATHVPLDVTRAQWAVLCERLDALTSEGKR